MYRRRGAPTRSATILGSDGVAPQMGCALSETDIASPCIVVLPIGAIQFVEEDIDQQGAVLELDAAPFALVDGG